MATATTPGSQLSSWIQEPQRHFLTEAASRAGGPKQGLAPNQEQLSCYLGEQDTLEAGRRKIGVLGPGYVSLLTKQAVNPQKVPSISFPPPQTNFSPVNHLGLTLPPSSPTYFLATPWTHSTVPSLPAWPQDLGKELRVP